MKLRMLDMIDAFVEEKAGQAAKRTETRLRSALERFALCMDERHGGGRWTLKDVTAEDGMSFYRELGGERGARELWQAVAALDYFFTYAVKEGWIERRPWRTLTGEKKKSRSTAEAAVPEYCAAMRCRNVLEYRDRALLPLVFLHRIGTTVLSKLNVADYDGTAITIASSFAWRRRRIELSDEERRYMDEYLAAREGHVVASHVVASHASTECMPSGVEALSTSEDALFLGEKYRRINPRVIVEVRSAYRMMLMEGSDGTM